MKIAGVQNGILKFEKTAPLLFFIILAGFLIRCSFIFCESLWPDEAFYMFIAKNLSLDPLRISGVRLAFCM